MRPSHFLIGISTLSLLAATVGCSSNTDTQDTQDTQDAQDAQDTAEVLLSKLRECGVLVDGHLYFDLPKVLTDDRCYADCFAEQSCAALKAFMCDRDLSLARVCDQRCGVRCGEGGYIRREQVCNGRVNCFDGSDEQDCPQTPEWLHCKSGAPYRAELQCDGREYCSDGTDEEGCASITCGASKQSIHPSRFCDGTIDCRNAYDERHCPTFVCADQTTLKGWVVCNGNIDCSGAEDEAMCGHPRWFPCDNGERVGPYRCDGYEDCSDGSDETNCAQLACEER